MLWIGEVEDAKSIDDLITAASITRRPILDFENLDFQDCKRTEESSTRKLQETNHHTRQVARMIYDFFKISGDNRAILDFRDLSKVHLKTDNVQAFDTKWNEVFSAVTDRYTESIWESLHKRCKLKSRKS